MSRNCAFEDILEYIEKAEAEGCVKCAPCREGRKWIKHLFTEKKIKKAQQDAYLEFLTEMAHQIAILSSCTKGKKLGLYVLEAIINNKYDINFHLESGECRTKY